MLGNGVFPVMVDNGVTRSAKKFAAVSVEKGSPKLGNTNSSGNVSLLGTGTRLLTSRRGRRTTIGTKSDPILLYIKRHHIYISVCAP